MANQGGMMTQVPAPFTEPGATSQVSDNSDDSSAPSLSINTDIPASIGLAPTQNKSRPTPPKLDTDPQSYWNRYSAMPRYQNMSPAKRARVKDTFFNAYISPTVTDDKQDQAYQDFRQQADQLDPKAKSSAKELLKGAKIGAAGTDIALLNVLQNDPIINKIGEIGGALGIPNVKEVLKQQQDILSKTEPATRASTASQIGQGLESVATMASEPLFVAQAIGEGMESSEQAQSAGGDKIDQAKAFIGTAAPQIAMGRLAPVVGKTVGKVITGTGAASKVAGTIARAGIGAAEGAGLQVAGNKLTGAPTDQSVVQMATMGAVGGAIHTGANPVKKPVTESASANTGEIPEPKYKPGDKVQINGKEQTIGPDAPVYDDDTKQHQYGVAGSDETVPENAINTQSATPGNADTSSNNFPRQKLPEDDQIQIAQKQLTQSTDPDEQKILQSEVDKLTQARDKKLANIKTAQVKRKLANTMFEAGHQDRGYQLQAEADKLDPPAPVAPKERPDRINRKRVTPHEGEVIPTIPDPNAPVDEETPEEPIEGQFTIQEALPNPNKPVPVNEPQPQGDQDATQNGKIQENSLEQHPERNESGKIPETGNSNSTVESGNEPQKEVKKPLPDVVVDRNATEHPVDSIVQNFGKNKNFEGITAVFSKENDGSYSMIEPHSGRVIGVGDNIETTQAAAKKFIKDRGVSVFNEDGESVNPDFPKPNDAVKFKFSNREPDGKNTPPNPEWNPIKGKRKLGEPLDPSTPVSTNESVPYAGGVTKDGQRVLIDKRMPKFVSVEDRNGKMVNVDAHEAVALHERVEAPRMHELGESYGTGHDVATKVENDFVSNKYNVDPEKYQKALGDAIDKAKIEARHEKPTEELDQKPYKDIGEKSELLDKKNNPASDIKRPENTLDDVSNAISKKLGKPVTVKQVVAPSLKAQNANKLIKKLFGREVKFFTTEHPAIDGLFDGKNIYVNAKNPHDAMMKTMGHELLHSLRKDNPKIYDSLVKNLGKSFNLNKAREIEQEMKARYGEQNVNLATDKAREEMIANVVGDHLVDPKFVRELQDRLEPSIFRKIASKIAQFLDDVKAKIMGEKQLPQSYKDLVTNIDSAKKAVMNALEEHGHTLTNRTEIPSDVQFNLRDVKQAPLRDKKTEEDLNKNTSSKYESKYNENVQKAAIEKADKNPEDALQYIESKTLQNKGSLDEGVSGEDIAAISYLAKKFRNDGDMSSYARALNVFRAARTKAGQALAYLQHEVEKTPVDWAKNMAYSEVLKPSLKQARDLKNAKGDQAARKKVFDQIAEDGEKLNDYLKKNKGVDLKTGIFAADKDMNPKAKEMVDNVNKAKRKHDLWLLKAELKLRTLAGEKEKLQSMSTSERMNYIEQKLADKESKQAKVLEPIAQNIKDIRKDINTYNRAAFNYYHMVAKAAAERKAIINGENSVWDMAAEWDRAALHTSLRLTQVKLTTDMAHTIYTALWENPVQALAKGGIPQVAKTLEHAFKGMQPGISKGLQMAFDTWKNDHDAFEQDFKYNRQEFLFKNGRAAEANKTFSPNEFSGSPSTLPKILRPIRWSIKAVQAIQSFADTLSAHMVLGHHSYMTGIEKGLTGEKLEDHVKSEMSNLGSDSWQRSINQSREITSTQDIDKNSIAGKMINAIQRMKSLDISKEIEKGNNETSARIKKLGTNLVFPFVKLPYNLLQPALTGKLSHYNILKTVVKGVGSAEYRKGPDFTKDLAGSIFTTALTYGVSQLRTDSNGDPRITGFMTGNNGITRDDGLPVHSIKYNGKWYDISKAGGAFSNVLGFAIDGLEAVHMLNEGQPLTNKTTIEPGLTKDDEKVLHRGVANKLGGSIMEHLAGESIFHGLGDIAKIFTTSMEGGQFNVEGLAKGVENEAFNVAMSFYPTMNNQIAGVNNDSVLQYTQKGVSNDNQRIMTKVQNHMGGIPVAKFANTLAGKPIFPENSSQPNIDPYGAEIPKDGDQFKTSYGWTIWNRLLNPVGETASEGQPNLIKDGNEAVRLAVSRYNDNGKGKTLGFPDRGMKFKVDGDEYEMTPEEHTTFMKRSGHNFAEAMKQEIDINHPDQWTNSDVDNIMALRREAENDAIQDILSDRENKGRK